MTQEQANRQLKWLAWMIVGVVVVLSVYMGGYYALLRRAGAWEIIQSPQESYVITWPSAAYKLSGERVEYFFLPAHTIDKVLRPGRWTPIRSPYPFRPSYPLRLTQ